MSKTKNIIKTGISINSDLLARCDASIPLTNAQSRSEFISDAIEYYIASLNAQGSSKVLTPALESVIGSKIALSEDRIYKGQKGCPPRNFRLDGDREAAWYFGNLFGNAV